MAGGPQRCEKHQQVHCMKCWKEKEGTVKATLPGSAPSDSVRARLMPEAPVAAPPVVVGAFDPPGDIEGFDAVSSSTAITTKAMPTPYVPVTIESTFANVPGSLPRVTQTESPEVAEFVEAARRHARATKTLKDLLAAIKAAKAEKKVATAEFKKMMRPVRDSVPRVKKPRKPKVPAMAEV